MSTRVVAIAIAAIVVAPLQAFAAAKSCASFATIKSYDKAASTVELNFEKGNQMKFFPRPSGSPASQNKLPKKCSGKVKKTPSFPVTPTGGRMTITQIRSNFDGKMLNDTNDNTWVPKQLEKLIADKTEVAVVLREGLGKDAPMGVTTIYLPVTDEELAEIERIEKQAEDVD